MAKVAIIEFNKFLNILGLRVAEPTQEEIFRIESLLKERSSLRREFRFAESDKIRKILSDEFSVRLIDHKARTIWMKIEDPH
jgi:cysteinyl-tRNA synthetase